MYFNQNGSSLSQYIWEPWHFHAQLNNPRKYSIHSNGSQERLPPIKANRKPRQNFPLPIKVGSWP